MYSPLQAVKPHRSCTCHPWQAFAAAQAALYRCPTNAKAWLRIAEACRAAGRWQLAHLYYSMAVERLGVADEAAKVRLRAAARRGTQCSVQMYGSY